MVNLNTGGLQRDLTAEKGSWVFAAVAYSNPVHVQLRDRLKNIGKTERLEDVDRWEHIKQKYFMKHREKTRSRVRLKSIKVKKKYKSSLIFIQKGVAWHWTVFRFFCPLANLIKSLQ